ncbi:MAG: homocysteine S-methyltransferase family protein [Myxococcota bacterium]|nr:homocysteine S-methyltransferase family protein [Myxococcota bacterium]
MKDWLHRLREGPPLLLDGATGTELERRGARCELPLWSARALLDDPELVRRIHADYVASGAELITANTFRTQRRALSHGGLGDRAEELTRLALQLAREAADGGRAALAVLGSAPPLEDCFRPDLVPDEAALAAEHAAHAEHLAAGGADAILVETMNTVREARAALAAAAATGLPALVGFVCWEGATLLSGEPLGEALRAVAELGPATVLVNCLPPRNVAPCLDVLRQAGLPFGVYANLGAPVEHGLYARTDECSPEEFAEYARGWLSAGANLVGGCCGTTPAHISILAQHLRSR